MQRISKSKKNKKNNQRIWLKANKVLNNDYYAEYDE